MAETLTITLGERTFELDRDKAEEAYAAKKVINGRNSMFFNILPLKYQWAYSLYREMKDSHWEPAETSLRADAAAFSQLSAECQTLVKATLGALACSQDIFQASTIYTVRDLLTAPELKLVFGRFVHEENTRSDLLTHLHESLSLDPSECLSLISTPALDAKSSFLNEKLSPLNRTTDTSTEEGQQALARNIFLVNQCMEGTQFHSLYAAIFSLSAQGKLQGFGKVLGHLLRDTTYRLSLFDQLLKEMVSENPGFWSISFQQELSSYMTAATKLEQDLAASLPMAEAGLDADALAEHLEHLADERLSSCGLARQFHKNGPFPWLDEAIHLTAAQTSTSTTSTLDTSFDDDDL